MYSGDMELNPPLHAPRRRFVQPDPTMRCKVWIFKTTRSLVSDGDLARNRRGSHHLKRRSNLPLGVHHHCTFRSAPAEQENSSKLLDPEHTNETLKGPRDAILYHQAPHDYLGDGEIVQLREFGSYHGAEADLKVNFDPGPWGAPHRRLAR